MLYFDQPSSLLRDVLSFSDGIDIVVVYFDQPDKEGHHHGPDSVQVAQAVQRMDSIVGLFLNGLEKHNLHSRVRSSVTPG